MKSFVEFLSEQYLIPVVIHNGKRYRGSPGESHAEIRERNGLESERRGFFDFSNGGNKYEDHKGNLHDTDSATNFAIDKLGWKPKYPGQPITSNDLDDL